MYIASVVTDIHTTEYKCVDKKIISSMKKGPRQRNHDKYFSVSMYRYFCREKDSPSDVFVICNLNFSVYISNSQIVD